MRDQIEQYVREFKVCRLCKFCNDDCSPTDGSCYPEWGGL